jgi:eukaryotic-like serine/threonine-protein kinase
MSNCLMNRTSGSVSETESVKRVSLATGSILQDRYRILRPLGKGGMGAVYEAIDLRLDTTVALKETFSTDARLRKQFEQEARLLAQLHHPALPRVTDYFSDGERVFLVMQFIAGDDLAEIIARQPGPLPRNQVVSWADQLLDALIYLHTLDRQIVHRDIKPHNLKLTANGRIALLDFGLAKADSENSATGSSSVFGFTRRYSPPEQMRDQGTGPRSDIYALGATLYHLLTGHKPPDALARASAVGKSEPDPLAPANEIHPAVGPEIAAVLRKSMALNPDHRFKDASEFREALRRLGRNDVRAISNWGEGCTTEATSPPSINTTIVGKPVAIDPFDSYSILKPAEMNWLVPKPSRWPMLIALVLGFLLVGGVYAFSDVSDWANLSKGARSYTATGARAPQSHPSPTAPKIENARANKTSAAVSTSAERRAGKPQGKVPRTNDSGVRRKISEPARAR